MKFEPLISIGMPVYNAAPYLAEALDGILGQSYPYLEIVICDNGSTDDSANIAQRFAAQDSRVRFYQNRWNIGFSGNMHKTTMLTRGDYLMVHAADDVMLPGVLEKYVETIRQIGGDPQDLVLMSDYYVVNQKGKRQSLVTLSADKQTHHILGLTDDLPTGEHLAILDGQAVLRQRFSMLLTFGWVGSILFSRRLYESVEGCYSNHWINPDKQFMFKLLSRNPRVLWLRQPLFHYRLHDFNQNAQQAESGTLKYLLDQYAFTFEFDNEYYQKFGNGRQATVEFFIEVDCLNTALREMAIGSRKLGFRHLCFGLAAYPDIVLRNPKTYAALIAWMCGPLLRPILSMLYRAKQADG